MYVLEINGHCHKLIRATAVEMAGSLYADIMRDNRVYAEWKQMCPDLTPVRCEIMFVEMMWPRLIAKARTTLAQLLTTNISDDLKSTIHDALVRDATLRRGRLLAKQVRH